MITTPSAAHPLVALPSRCLLPAADGSLYAGVAQQVEHPPCKWVVASSNPAAGSSHVSQPLAPAMRHQSRTAHPADHSQGLSIRFAAMGAPHCAGSKSTPARFLNDSAVKPETRDRNRPTRARKAERSDAESPIQPGLFEREDLPRRTDAEVEAWLRDLPF